MAVISVVVSSWKYWKDPLKLQPMWELYYATILHEKFKGHSVRIIDTRDIAESSAIEDLPESDVYVYWIMKSADAFELYERCAYQKRLFPESLHIAGGTHVDHMASQCAEYFDVVLQGTAEDTLVAAITEFLSGSKPSPMYERQSACHFSSFPMPDRSFLPTTKIVNKKHFQKYGGVVGTGVYFSRGCSFRCKFCVYNNPGKFQYRTPSQIRDELSYLKKDYGVAGVNLRDEVCIPVKRSEAVSYLEAIGSADVIWRGQSVPLGTEEMVRLAAESGLQEVALGLESVDSDEVLKISNKPSKSIADNNRYINLLRKYGIRVKVCLILGLPGESKEVATRTLKFLDEVKPDYVAISGFDPVPGSPFYANPKQYGIKVIDSDLRRHAHLIHRFDSDETVGLPFEYEKETPWGRGLSREEILDNILTVQSYIREREMSY